MDESCHTYAWVMPHICMSHVTQSCHTCRDKFIEAEAFAKLARRLKENVSAGLIHRTTNARPRCSRHELADDDSVNESRRNKRTGSLVSAQAHVYCSEAWHLLFCEWVPQKHVWHDSFTSRAYVWHDSISMCDMTQSQCNAALNSVTVYLSLCVFVLWSCVYVYVCFCVYVCVNVCVCVYICHMTQFRRHAALSSHTTQVTRLICVSQTIHSSYIYVPWLHHNAIQHWTDTGSQPDFMNLHDSCLFYLVPLKRDQKDRD